MSWLLWTGIPLLPLIGWGLLCSYPALGKWLALVTFPALIAVFIVPASLALPGLWPGAQLGLGSLVNQAFLGFSALLWAIATIYSASSEQDHPRQTRYWFFWTVAMSGNFLLLIAQDPVSFYAGFTLMSLAAYGLIVHYQGPLPRQAGRLYLQLAVLGEMLLYAGLVMRVHETGGLMLFADWQTVPIQTTTAFLLLVGFGLKAGFWPLHIWLPLAHPVAPAAASAVLSGAMLKAGILGIWQFIPVESAFSQQYAPMLFYIAIFSAFYGVAAGLIQQKTKTVLAFSSVSQISYLVIIVALAWQDPENLSVWITLLAFYAVHHGLAKGALFLGAGLTSSYQLTRWQFALLFIPALALAGMPFTGGAVVKNLLKDGVGSSLFEAHLPMLTLASLASALLVFRALSCMWRDQQQVGLLPTKKAQVYSWVLLSLMPIVIPLSWPIMHHSFIDLLSLASIWKLLWPIGLAALISVVFLLKPVQLPKLSSAIGRRLSLRVKFWQNHLPIPEGSIFINAAKLRRVERRCNHHLKASAISFSVVMMAISLVLLALLLS
ncbi:complex I subunit 5 family protein [Methylophaga sp.]|uniref:complex I subunit 5 family protein n=1 Tax=Methylophaga sp. TaxID=2024840 RepID=UPI00271C663D|nr:proton-conducting transporter membrane subunit [Methylophaga sp.]MDO8828443.1 proton-conducting transporter membrane subunit [Methylophaga sp.]